MVQFLVSHTALSLWANKLLHSRNSNQIASRLGTKKMFQVYGLPEPLPKGLQPELLPDPLTSEQYGML